MRMTEAEINQKQIEYRRHLNSLMISGKAMIALGVWTTMRVVLTMLLGQNNLRKFIMQYVIDSDIVIDDINEFGINIIIVVLFVIVLVICLISFSINYIAGIGAYREGKGVKKGKVYIFFIVLILLSTLWIYVVRLLPTSPQAVQEVQGETFLNEQGSVLLDFTQMMICVDVLYAMIKSRKISRELKEVQAV